MTNETFEIYSRRSEYYQKSKRKTIYLTSEGEMPALVLAKRLDLSLPGLNTRIRAYGLTDPRVVHGPRYQQPSEPDWEGLGGKPRTRNLAKLEGKTMSHYLNI